MPLRNVIHVLDPLDMIVTLGPFASMSTSKFKVYRVYKYLRFALLAKIFLKEEQVTVHSLLL